MAAKRVTAKEGVSLLGFETQYEELNKEYLALSHRELDIHEDCGDGKPKPVTSDGRCIKISGVDFAAELEPVPEGALVQNESDVMKYAMLVWRLLDACESGGVGGDACRQRGVIYAAVNDAMAKLVPSQRFEHLLGCVVAFSNHGLRSFVLRSYAEEDQRVFSALGGAFKKLFKMKAIEGVSSDLRGLAIEWCRCLQRHLKSYGGKGWEGTGAAKFSFTFGVKPVPTRVRKRKGESDESVAKRRAALAASKAKK